MAKEFTIIPAVAYLRKSTDSKGKDGKERQEKSIPQQIGEIKLLRPKSKMRDLVCHKYAGPR